MKRIIVALMVVIALAIGYNKLKSQSIEVEVIAVSRLDVEQYIEEDAKTRLDEEFTIHMPITGTLRRVELEVGDSVKKGQIVASIDVSPLEHRLESLAALIKAAMAQINGVDAGKPKQEELEAAQKKIEEMQNAVEIAHKESSIVSTDHDDRKKNFERMKALLKERVVTQAEYDTALNAYSKAKQNLERAAFSENSAGKALDIAKLNAKRLSSSTDDNEYLRDFFKAQISDLEAQRQMLEEDLERAVITAPESGPVLEKYILDSSVLAAGIPIIKIGDLNSIEIECDVLSDEVVMINPKDRVIITGKAIGDYESADGTVKEIWPSGFTKISSLGIEQQRVRVIVSFDNEKLQLRPGTSVDLRIITETHFNAMAVPERAVFRQDGGWAVFVVQEGLAYMKPITIGIRNDSWAEITEGLSESDLVIINPSNDLQDAAQVSFQSVN